MYLSISFIVFSWQLYDRLVTRQNIAKRRKVPLYTPLSQSITQIIDIVGSSAMWGLMWFPILAVVVVTEFFVSKR